MSQTYINTFAMKYIDKCHYINVINDHKRVHVKHPQNIAMNNIYSTESNAASQLMF